MRLFLDANVLFTAAVSPNGASAGLIALAEAGVCELVTSTLAVAEATRNLRAKAPAAMDRWGVVDTVVGIVPEGDPRLLMRVDVVLDAKDRPILAAALGCRATVLVTGDRRHFGPLFGRAIGGTLVVPPREALDRLLAGLGRERGDVGR